MSRFATSTVRGILLSMTTITPSKSKVREENGVVVLPVAEYQRLLAAAVPEVYLTGKVALKLDKLVEDSMREYRAGKTMTASSISEAVKKFKAHAH